MKMKIQKHSAVTKDNVKVNTVVIHFDSFKPVQLSLNESSYFGMIDSDLTTLISTYVKGILNQDAAVNSMYSKLKES